MTPCEKTKEQLSAYVDREIDAEQARAIAAHLAQCPPCSEAAQSEQAIKTLVHERAQGFSAPVALRARIQRGLSDANARFGFWQLVRELWALHPQPALAALATLVLATSALTYWGGTTLANDSDPIAYVTNARVEGTLVCADCQLMLATQTPCVHDAGAHRVVLRSKDGRLWNIVQSSPGRELARNLNENARRVQTEGYLFQRAGYIQVTNFKFLQN